MSNEIRGLGTFFSVAAFAAAVHLLLLHWSIFHGVPSDSPMPVSSLLVNLGFVALAGVLYGLLLRRLVNIGIGEPKSAPKVLLSGGFRAVLATAASFQARYIAMGVVLAQEGVRQVHGSTFTTSFLISMLPIETYGVIDIIYSVVPAFACGFLATWFLPKILRRAAL